ncbi:MAG: oligosaccharide flippase family protein [Methyloceanibacter sp.]|nr:oligosaccharide flippase family protein [Methyloceanibacter sp.]
MKRHGGDSHRSTRRARLTKASGLFSTSSLLTGARIAGALAGFVTQVVLARTLQASALGLFYSVTSLAAIMSLIVALGYPAIAPRFMSRYRKQGKSELIAAFVARARRDAMFYVAIGTGSLLALAWSWPSFSTEARWALTAAALSIPAGASIRVNGSFATALRRFALSYLPDTSIRPFVLLGGILVLLALDVTLTPARVSWLLTGTISALALGQFILVCKVMPSKAAPPAPARLVKLWQREAWPQIVVTLYINFFADVDILLVTPLLTSAETAAIGLCLKLSLLVGFAVQIAHQVVVPDLADARARKEPHAIHEALLKAVAFPLIITFAALATVVLFGDRLLAIFGPEFTSAKLPLVILMACQFARAVFGPSVSLLTVIGAQRQNALLAVAALVVLAIGNIVLAPLYGVVGAAIAVAIATLFWLVACAVVLGRVSGLRTDALYLLGRSASPRSAPA